MVKLYASILQQKEQSGEKEAAQEITQLMIDRLPQFVQSADLEVQERVREQNCFGIYHTKCLILLSQFVFKHIRNFLGTCTFCEPLLSTERCAASVLRVTGEREALELEWEEW